jgi:hypothetical protein
MSRQYHIIPADFSPDNVPPAKIRELHRDGADEHNAEIVIMENGIVVDRMMYRPHLEYKYDAKIPQVPDRIHAAGETHTQILGKEPAPPLRSGAPPIYQAVFKICSEAEGGETAEEIKKELKSLGWFEDVPFASVKNVDRALEILKDNLVLSPDPDRGTWHPGVRKLEDFYDMGENGYDMLEGEYPTVRLARDILERNGTMKAYDLLDRVMKWNWAVSRKYGRKWITYTMDKKYIRHVGDKVLAPHRVIK